MRRLESLGAKVAGVMRGDGGLELVEVLRMLRGKHGVSTAMVESGPRLLGAMVDGGLVDEAVVYVAPTVLGDDEAVGAVGGRVALRLADGVKWGLVRHSKVGEDLRLVYRRVRA